MTSQELKDKLSTDDVIRYVTEYLGSDEPEYVGGIPVFQTICHNPAHHGKHKLFYYPDSKQFHCYTECAENFDIFSLTAKAKHLDAVSDFKKCFNTVAEFFQFNKNQSAFIDNSETEEVTDGWNILRKFKTFNSPKKTLLPLPVYPKNILDNFGPSVAPSEWLKEGITIDAMQHFGIRVDSAMKKIIIPHYDINGNLCGVRGRSFDPDEVADGKKYMPAYVEQQCLKHPLGQNLYGIYENQEVIKRLKKVAIFEGEKSVLLCASYYNRYVNQINSQTGELQTVYENNNFAVATCGSSFSQQQLKLLLGLGINEIIFCYDKENDDDHDSDLTRRYEEKLLKILTPLTKYVNIYVVMDYDGLLDYKDSPADKGRDILEQLMKNKQKVLAIEADTERQRKLN